MQSAKRTEAKRPREESSLQSEEKQKKEIKMQQQQNEEINKKRSRRLSIIQQDRLEETEVRHCCCCCYYQLLILLLLVLLLLFIFIVFIRLAFLLLYWRVNFTLFSSVSLLSLLISFLVVYCFCFTSLCFVPSAASLLLCISFYFNLFLSLFVFALSFVFVRFFYNCT